LAQLKPRVFLDVTALKASRDAEVVMIPTTRSLQWGPNNVDVTVHKPMRYNQNAKLLNVTRGGGVQIDDFRERSAHRFVARLADEGKITLLISDWLQIESWSVPRVGDYYGSPIEVTDSPIPFGGVYLDGRHPEGDYPFEYLKFAVDLDSRLRNIATKTGGCQAGTYHRQQLFDATHIWAAEHARADYLLTHDDKLVRHLRTQNFQSSVQLVGTRQLLGELTSQHPTWLFSILRELWRLTRAHR
jgi:hypothetical protein